MTRSTVVALTLLFAMTVAAQTVPQYTVSLSPVAFGGTQSVPGLQSFARAVGPGGQWLLVAGRTNGLHSLTAQSSGSAAPPNAFPPQQANTQLWVIDPVAKTVYAPVNVPSPPLGDALTVSNPAFYKDGDTLYVVGGYGQQSSTGTMITFPTITTIPVTATINAIMAGKPLPSFTQVAQWYDCYSLANNAAAACFNNNGTPASCNATQASTLQACNSAFLSNSGSIPSGYQPSNTGPAYVTVGGGGMQKTGSVFWLVFGQNFQGLYSSNPGDYGRWPVLQQYTERMTALWLGNLKDANGNGQLVAAILNVLPGNPNATGNPPTIQWHRRDLNVVPAIDTDGTAMISAYGGVFVPGRLAAFQQPIYLNGAANPTSAQPALDPYAQLFSQYDCANLVMYSAASKTMHTVFFGGISLYYASGTTLHQDTGLPFVNDLSVLTRSPNSAYDPSDPNSAKYTNAEFYASTPLPSLMGADATFIPDPGAPVYSGEIIALDKITANQRVGWIYGGIVATAPQSENGKTMASNAAYEVWISPGPQTPGKFWNLATPQDTAVIKVP